MSHRLDIRPIVDADIDAYFYFIAEDSPSAAFRFVDAAQDTINKIARNPGVGRPRELTNPTLSGLRSLSIDGFPNHLVIYRIVDENTVRIVRVRHGAMDLDAMPMDDPK